MQLNRAVLQPEGKQGRTSWPDAIRIEIYRPTRLDRINSDDIREHLYVFAATNKINIMLFSGF
jgi:hypothetical protein